MKHLAILFQRHVLVVCLLALFGSTAYSQVVINEIFYNVPGNDDFEFIELHNVGATAVNLGGYTFVEGVTHTFPAGVTISAGGYLVISNDSAALEAQFAGVTARQWNSGVLTNGGEDITLVNPMGVTVDSVDFEDNSGGWATVCDSRGPSLSLCDPLSDNNLSSNWSFSTTSTGTTYGNFGQEIFATPGAANGTCPTTPVIFFSGIETFLNEDTSVHTIFAQMANIGTNDTATVDVNIVGSSTATSGVDYVLGTTTLFFGQSNGGGFPGGRTSLTFDITITDDMMFEPTETIELQLANPMLGAVVMGGNNVIQILDNDGPTYYPIGTVTADANTNFVPDSTGVNCELRGIVHGVDMQGSANNIQFTLIDGTGGIGAINFGNAYGYTVSEGDSVHVWGTIEQFRGLNQIRLDTVILISSGNTPNTPAVVTMLDESTESEVIRINGVSLVDPTQWPASGSANVDITDGTTNFVIRIDSDTDVDGTPAPAGMFDVAGIGGQFDGDTPADSGYQILPRYIADVITAPAVMGPPNYPIGTVTADSNSDFIPDSLGVRCDLRGIVHGVDMQGSANNIQFTLIDGTGGIAVVSFGNAFGYTVAEGDSVHAWGTIEQFRGLNQTRLDTMVLISSGNTPNTPAVVTTLDESTESEVIRINGVSLVDPTQWPASGSANVDITDGTNNFVIRIDSDTDVDGTPAPAGMFDVAGIGGQFDGDTPADSGYQILPRYIADIITAPITGGPAYYPIGTVTADSNGDFIPDSIGVRCDLRGIVHGVDMQGSANNIQFTLIDGTGGIAVVSFGNAFGYTVAEGDSVHAWGTIEQFRGLNQTRLDTMVLISSGNTPNTPAVVTMLDESTESEVIRINGVSLVDPTQWPASGSANVDITDGTTNFVIRIDSDTDVDGTPAPAGIFDVAGIGGQFDGDTPADSGYQILPRYIADIITAPITGGPAYYPIGTVTADSNGDFIPDSIGVRCDLRGIVHGVDMQGSANNIQFTLIDGTGGIGVISFGNTFGYTVAEGDSVHAWGTIEQFRGLNQTRLDTMVLVSPGNTPNTPAVVATLDESTESEVVRINGVTLVNAAQWPASGSANVDITDGTNNFVIRIDSDTDVDGTPAPVGTFDIAGIGGQFDADTPADSGYQILPRYIADVITTVIPPLPAYPLYPIALVNADADGDLVGDSVGVQCELRGVVHGVNLRPNGLQFTFHDGTRGIGLFSGGNPFGYTVNEGDSVQIKGSISEFNGLTQINPDSLTFISGGNALHPLGVITDLNEDAESELVTIECFKFVDKTQWTGSGSGFNLDVTNNVDTFAVRIDNDVDLYALPAPVANWFDMTGIGGQFDSGNPITGGYQLLPRYSMDVLPLPDPSVSFKATNVDTVDESTPTALLEIEILNSNPDTTTITLDITASSTANNTDDYNLMSTTNVFTVFGKGTQTVGIDIPIVDDGINEPLEFIEFTISADNNSGISVNTYRLYIRDNDPVSIDGTLPKSAVVAYPNPGNDLLIVDGSVRMDHIDVMDLSGRTLMSQDVDAVSSRINTSELAAGTYILRVQTAQGSWTGRWVKM